MIVPTSTLVLTLPRRSSQRSGDSTRHRDPGGSEARNARIAADRRSSSQLHAVENHGGDLSPG